VPGRWPPTPSVPALQARHEFQPQYSSSHGLRGPILHIDMTTMSTLEGVDDVGFAWVGVKATGEVEEEGSAQLARVEEERENR
jgi:hypothetical protein